MLEPSWGVFGNINSNECDFEQSSAQLLGAQTQNDADWAFERERDKLYLEQIEEERKRAIITQQKKEADEALQKKQAEERHNKARARMVSQALKQAETVDIPQGRERARRASMVLVRANVTSSGRKQDEPPRDHVDSSEQERAAPTRRKSSRSNKLSRSSTLRRSRSSDDCSHKLSKSTLRRTRSSDGSMLTEGRRPSECGIEPLNTGRCDAKTGDQNDSSEQERRAAPTRNNSTRSKPSRPSVRRNRSSGGDNLTRRQSNSDPVLRASERGDAPVKRKGSNRKKKKSETSEPKEQHIVESLFEEGSVDWIRNATEIKMCKSTPVSAGESKADPSSDSSTEKAKPLSSKPATGVEELAHTSKPTMDRSIEECAPTVEHVERWQSSDSSIDFGAVFTIEGSGSAPATIAEKRESSRSALEASAFEFNHVGPRPIGKQLGNMFGKVLSSTRGR